MLAPDAHTGSRAREIIRDPSGARYTLFQAAVELMRRGGLLKSDGSGMPIHSALFADDQTHGQNHVYAWRPHPHQLSYADIERGMLEARAEFEELLGRGASVDKLRKAFCAVQDLGLEQLDIRGEDWPEAQLDQHLSRIVRPSTDFFNAVLRRSLRAKFRIRGIGDYHGRAGDSRNPGVVNILSGNHLGNTIDDAFTEGTLIRTALLGYLGALPYWKNREEVLGKLVRSPRYCVTGWAQGTFEIEGGYRYGLEVRSSPAKLSSWSDVLLAVMANDQARGDATHGMHGGFTFRTYGDKHMLASACTDMDLYHMCGAGTHSDDYGERGFPANNMSVSFVLFDSRGPDYGEILVRSLCVDDLVYFIQHPRETIDWEALLPNPA